MNYQQNNYARAIYRKILVFRVCMFISLFVSFVFSPSILLRFLLLIFLFILNDQNPPQIKYISPLVPMILTELILSHRHVLTMYIKGNSNLHLEKFCFSFLQVSTLLGKDFTYSGSFTQYQNFSNLNQAPHVRIFKHRRNASVLESLLVKSQTEKKPLLLKRTPIRSILSRGGRCCKIRESRYY